MSDASKLEAADGIKRPFVSGTTEISGLSLEGKFVSCEMLINPVWKTHAVMNTLRKLIASLIHRLQKYTFGSDYLADQNIIESVRSVYATRISPDEPSRYFWRSICQYKCQSFARGKIRGLASNVVAFLCLPFVSFYLRPARKTAGELVASKYLKINFHMAYQVPPMIRGDTLEVSVDKKYLTLKDWRFAWGVFIKNRAFYPELLFKFLLWVASVRPYIDSHKMQYLIQYCEYSAYSSLRKLYLNNNGIL